MELLDEYAPRYTDAFPDVRVRFKQISFSQAVYPIELRLSGENLDSLKTGWEIPEHVASDAGNTAGTDQLQ